MSKIPERIVAEISKTWRGDQAPEEMHAVMAHRFEHVIKINALRGYALEDWKFGQVMVPGGLVETIVAVFVAVGEGLTTEVTESTEGGGDGGS